MLRGRGQRVGSRLLVVHTFCPPDRRAAPVRVGFVVSRAVGGAVVRNRTKRRLRHLCAARLAGAGAGIDVVVRANPPAGQASSAELAAALDAALSVLRSRCEVRT